MCVCGSMTGKRVRGPVTKIMIRNLEMLGGGRKEGRKEI